MCEHYCLYVLYVSFLKSGQHFGAIFLKKCEHYCSFVALLSYAYTSNTTRAGYSRADQFYASYPAGTEMLTDTAKLYKAALGNCFEAEEWGPISGANSVAKHLKDQEIIYHAQYMTHLGLRDNWMEVA
ncbi:hypothetical protein Leryth_003222 [Lithospermum erythrorhizon]|nr:hypothetical protein Leryth_003222 [Lithospermum erythrorhizon]